VENLATKDDWLMNRDAPLDVRIITATREIIVMSCWTQYTNTTNVIPADDFTLLMPPSGMLAHVWTRVDMRRFCKLSFVVCHSRIVVSYGTFTCFFSVSINPYTRKLRPEGASMGFGRYGYGLLKRTQGSPMIFLKSMRLQWGTRKSRM
jgi:hypothetical protein